MAWHSAVNNENETNLVIKINREKNGLTLGR